MANDGDLTFSFVISLRCLGCLGQSSPRKPQDGSFGEVFSLPLSLSLFPFSGKWTQTVCDIFQTVISSHKTFGVFVFAVHAIQLLGFEC